ncbi:MAG TPA: response regulator transcription factor [Gammaproteobacteria bacterium]|nr:response regulator transcription factor [Gammaproteobacteria bacterium]
MARVLIADDHTIFRAGLAKLLQTIADVQVVAEASSGREAVELADKHHPDIVIMDLAMSDVNGLDATAQMHAQHADIRIIILSMHANEEYVMQALSAGASAYVLKEATPDELKLAIEAVARGGTFLSAAISKRVMEDYFGQAVGKPSHAQHLTPRQKQILHLISEGKNVKQIAFELKVSIKTVESHRTQLMERLGIPNATALVRYAARLSPLSNK